MSAGPGLRTRLFGAAHLVDALEEAGGGPVREEAEEVAEVGPGLDAVELAAGEEGDFSTIEQAIRRSSWFDTTVINGDS